MKKKAFSGRTFEATRNAFTNTPKVRVKNGELSRHFNKRLAYENRLVNNLKCLRREVKKSSNPPSLELTLENYGSPMTIHIYCKRYFPIANRPMDQSFSLFRLIHYCPPKTFGKKCFRIANASEAS
jgi:hypothetical protein